MKRRSLTTLRKGGKNRAKMIAICGLVCTECPAYLTTQKDDNEERKKIAERWSTKEFPLKPEDVNCDGCLAVGKRLLNYSNACQVSACRLFVKKVKNCAYCNEYPCQKLDKLLKDIQAPEAKATLEEIRKSLPI